MGEYVSDGCRSLWHLPRTLPSTLVIIFYIDESWL